MLYITEGLAQEMRYSMSSFCCFDEMGDGGMAALDASREAMRKHHGKARLTVDTQHGKEECTVPEPFIHTVIVVQYTNASCCELI